MFYENLSKIYYKSESRHETIYETNKEVKKYKQKLLGNSTFKRQYSFS